jgi:hypothetical protein
LPDPDDPEPLEEDEELLDEPDELDELDDELLLLEEDDDELLLDDEELLLDEADDEDADDEDEEEDEVEILVGSVNLSQPPTRTPPAAIAPPDKRIRNSRRFASRLVSSLASGEVARTVVGLSAMGRSLRIHRSLDGDRAVRSRQPSKCSSILRITSSAVIMSMHRGRAPTTSTHSSSGRSFASPSPSGRVRDFQQPP